MLVVVAQEPRLRDVGDRSVRQSRNRRLQSRTCVGILERARKTHAIGPDRPAANDPQVDAAAALVGDDPFPAVVGDDADVVALNAGYEAALTIIAGNIVHSA